MEGNKYLAQELAKKKNDDLEQIANVLVDNICQLAKLRYRESFLEFTFSNAGFFLKNTVEKMEYPKELKNKLKRLEKLNSLVSEKEVTDDFENEDEMKTQRCEKNEQDGSNTKSNKLAGFQKGKGSTGNEEELMLTEDEKLLVSIIQTFNEIETTVFEEHTPGQSEEQKEVLKKVIEKLNLDGFKTEQYTGKLQVWWWGTSK